MDSAADKVSSSDVKILACCSGIAWLVIIN